MQVCIVIVTYNRKEELKKCLDANLNQTISADILVVDNASTDDTQNMMKDYMKNKRVKYVRLPENVGGSGGFYYGMKLAFEKGNFDYVWLMDDDGRPWREDALECVLNVACKLETREVILNSLVLCDENTLSFWIKGERKRKKIVRSMGHGTVLEGYINPFNGTLISYETYKKIGLPRKDFFIKGDEEEYQRRAARNDIFIATCLQSIFYHPKLQFEPKGFGKRTIYVYNEPYWKIYYRARNQLSVLKLYGTKKQIFWHIVDTLYSSLYYKDDKKRKFRYALWGVLDGAGNHFPRIEIK